jgi:hypothetical protein
MELDLQTKKTNTTKENQIERHNQKKLWRNKFIKTQPRTKYKIYNKILIKNQFINDQNRPLKIVKICIKIYHPNYR